jgi:Fe-S-cluster containining protein
MVERLVAKAAGQGPLAAGRVSLVIAGEPVEIELAAPAGPATLEDLLPIFQGLSNLFTARGVARAEAQGRAVTCRAGCGACCRQLVPVSETEAHALAALVEAMPEPRRGQVQARFEAAIDALAPSDMLSRAAEPHEGRSELGIDYFRLGVACPFLEAEACSIHPDRPLACREYLVTSPAQACADLDASAIVKVELDGAPSRALQAAGGGGWLPLVLALRFAEQWPPPPPASTGPELLADVLRRL